MSDFNTLFPATPQIMSTPTPAYTQNPSFHQPLDSDDDPDDPHQHLHATSSTNLTDQRFQRFSISSPHRRASPDSTKRQVMEHSDNTSPGSPYERFEWQPVPTGRRHSESHSPPLRILEPSGATKARYQASDIDSLLESPLPSPSPQSNTRSQRHRSAHSSLGSIATTITRDGQSPSGRKSGHSIAALSEKAFKSPIILKSSSSGQLRSMHPQEIIDQRSQMTATWGIYWYLPSMMIAVFFAGVLGAVGHHVFYNSLHGKQSKYQLSMIRIGTAFAFFVKANLVGAVVLAYR